MTIKRGLNAVDWKKAKSLLAQGASPEAVAKQFKVHIDVIKNFLEASDAPKKAAPKKVAAPKTAPGKTAPPADEE